MDVLHFLSCAFCGTWLEEDTKMLVSLTHVIAFCLQQTITNAHFKINMQGNNWIIIQAALILTDLVLDIAFVVFHSKDIPDLFVPRYVFL